MGKIIGIITAIIWGAIFMLAYDLSTPCDTIALSVPDGELEPLVVEAVNEWNSRTGLELFSVEQKSDSQVIVDTNSLGREDLVGRGGYWGGVFGVKIFRPEKENLYLIILHELGHAHIFGHSEIGGDVMFEYYQDSVDRLSDNDVEMMLNACGE